MQQQSENQPFPAGDRSGVHLLEWVLVDRWLARMPFRPAMQIVTADLELHAWQWRALEQWAL